MALSRLTPERLLNRFAENIRAVWNASSILPRMESCSCQDTENNNETECYFYFKDEEIDAGEVETCAIVLCHHLGVPEDAFTIEHNECNQWRIEIICELTINGAKLIPNK